MRLYFMERACQAHIMGCPLAKRTTRKAPPKSPPSQARWDRAGAKLLAVRAQAQAYRLDPGFGVRRRSSSRAIQAPVEPQYLGSFAVPIAIYI